MILEHKDMKNVCVTDYLSLITGGVAAAAISDTETTKVGLGSRLGLPGC